MGAGDEVSNARAGSHGLMQNPHGLPCSAIRCERAAACVESHGAAPCMCLLRMCLLLRVAHELVLQERLGVWGRSGPPLIRRVGVGRAYAKNGSTLLKSACIGLLG